MYGYISVVVKKTASLERFRLQRVPRELFASGVPDRAHLYFPESSQQILDAYGKRSSS